MLHPGLVLKAVELPMMYLEQASSLFQLAISAKESKVCKIDACAHEVWHWKAVACEE